MILQFFILSVVFAVLVGGLTYVLDPLQYYRKSTWYSPVFTSEQRYQNPGLVRNYSYDTIILGTSMTENFLPSVVGEALGGQAIKLSMRGSTADEQYKIASLALETGKVKKVLWGLDYFALKDPDEGADAFFPAYLYDDKWWNDYPYWFSYSAYENFAKGMLKQLSGQPGQDIEHLYSWHYGTKYGSKEVLQAYDRARNTEYYFGVNEEPMERVQDHFNTYVLSLVERYPDVEFIVYYPPYSILRQKLWLDTNPARYHNQLEMKTWMFEQFNRYENTQVYDFQAESDWTYDFTQFKDLSHHSQDINSRIARAIGEEDERYKVTVDNVAALTERLAKQVNTVMIAGDEARSVEVLLGEGGNPQVFSSVTLPDKEELMVPVKEFASLTGITTAVDRGKLILSGKGPVVEMVVDSKRIMVSKSKEDRIHGIAKSEMTLAHHPYIAGGKTMIPLVATAGILGYEIQIRNPAPYTYQYVLSLPLRQ
ncbi:hypothetical protein JCM10914_1927 [Paenibacillus sp. JCM 10914]|nr:hypothetical protein JCM10914_1927 [Paenibacillus sp. JCM 10914]